jgi:hypothetical protein
MCFFQIEYTGKIKIEDEKHCLHWEHESSEDNNWMEFQKSFCCRHVHTSLSITDISSSWCNVLDVGINIDPIYNVIGGEKKWELYDVDEAVNKWVVKDKNVKLKSSGSGS